MVEIGIGTALSVQELCDVADAGDDPGPLKDIPVMVKINKKYYFVVGAEIKLSKRSEDPFLVIKARPAIGL